MLAVLLQGVPLPPSLLESASDPGEARAAWIVLSMLVLMGVWWVTEAIPIPVTSLLPLVILPVCGVLTISEAAAPYMHPVVVLLLGGFIVAKAIERWNLHARIALTIVDRIGTSPTRLIAGFMFASAILSMWISNTATSIMMMPIAISAAAEIVGRDRLDSPFTWALLLGIAWSCSIGGLGTLVGTPTNLIVVGYLNDNAGLDIDFVQWMMIGLPAVAFLLPAAWFVLTRWAFSIERTGQSGGRDAIGADLRALGRVTTPEWRTIGVFAAVAFLWVFRRQLAQIELAGTTPFAGLTDHVIAIIGVILCFVVPSGAARAPRSALLDWKSAESIPWGVLLLFGGGFSLANAITVTGLSPWIGRELAVFATVPTVVLVAIITALVMFLTEVTSNVATASALIPVFGALALSTGIDVGLLAVPLALSASCAFMLPMATGPNAVAFATGHVTLATMARAGLRLNLVAIALLTAITCILVPLVF
ncbi:MAG: SLC13 family permease [Pseudomonadota bacterium]